MESAVHFDAKIVQAIYDTIKDVLERDDLLLSLQSKLIEDLSLDSMTVIGLLVGLEDRVPGFKIDNSDLDASHLETIESLAQYISKNYTIQ